jgi:tRNA uridine 5-carbamoylmethylation protein Kti12
MVTYYTPEEILLLKNRRGGNKVTAELVNKLYERDIKGNKETSS